MASYALEKKWAKQPERFGKGAIEGVAGPETANNAAAISSFIPLLTLGIPTNPVMALILGALVLQGIQPGPRLIAENPAVFWGVIDSIYIGNIFLLIMSIPLVGIFVKMIAIRESILAPIVVVVTMLGVYTINNSTFDMLVVIGFGVLGYLMKKPVSSPGPWCWPSCWAGLSRPRSSSRCARDLTGFAGRPISGTLLAMLVVIAVISPMLGLGRRYIKSSSKRAEGRNKPRGADLTSVGSSRDWTAVDE